MSKYLIFLQNYKKSMIQTNETYKKSMIRFGKTYKKTMIRELIQFPGHPCLLDLRRTIDCWCLLFAVDNE